MAMQEGLVARDKRVTRKYLSIYTKFFILNLADEWEVKIMLTA